MSINRGKVVIIGTSNVGSAVLNKIADFQLASEIALIDLDMNRARGEALDTSHAMSSPYCTNISSSRRGPRSCPGRRPTD